MSRTVVRVRESDVQLWKKLARDNYHFSCLLLTMKLLMSSPFVRRFLTLRALFNPLRSFAEQDWAAREELELELEIGLKDHGPEAEGYHPVTIGDAQ